MHLHARNISVYPTLCWWPLVLALFVLLSAGGSWAADPATPISSLSPRAKLDRLLVCEQAEREAALAERPKALEKIADIETFIRSLSDRPVHYAAHERADRALTLAREALAKIDERIRLADLRIRMTLRSLQYLKPEQGGVTKASPSIDEPRRELNRQADCENEGRYADGYYGSEYGFVTDPILVSRLTSLVNRLQLLSPRPDVPITVRVLADESRLGAFATANTVFFDKAYLDRSPSESELMFTAAHELAHIQLGHFSETIIKSEQDKQRLEEQFAKEFGSEGSKALGKRSKEVLLKMRTGLWEQRQEEAADLLGAQQALEAGASPQGIYEAMLQMDADEKAFWQKNGVAQDIQRYKDSLRDHPKPLDRLKALEAVLGEKFWERTDLKFGGPCH